MIKKFSIIVFLFAFSAQSETLYPTGRKKEMAYAAQLGGDKQISRIRIKNDKEKDKIFVKDCETHTDDLSGTIKNHRIAPSNKLKNLRPTDRAQSKRKKNQASRAFLDKPRIKREELIKKIEDFLGTDPEITKSQLCIKLNISECDFYRFLINLEEKNPKLFQNLNLKRPIIFSIEKLEKKGITLKEIKGILGTDPEITKLELCIKLKVSRWNFWYFLKNLQKETPKIFQELNVKYPNIFCLKIRKKNEKKESEFEKIPQNMIVEKILLDKRRIKREESIKKIEEIADADPEITKKELCLKLNINEKKFYDFLRNLQEKNFELFKELNLKYPNIFCLKIHKKNEKKESEFEKNPQNMIIEKIKYKKVSVDTMFTRIKEILTDNPQIYISRLAKKLAIYRMTLIINLKALRLKDRQKFEELDNLSTYGLLDTRRIRREESIKKIKEIADADPKITKKELCRKLNTHEKNFWSFLKNLQEKNFQLFEELNLKYPNIFCLKIYKKNEKKESEFEKISQNMTIEKIKNKKVSMETMLNRIKEILAKNPEINISHLAKELAIPRMTLIARLEALQRKDRQKFDELDNLSNYGLLDIREKKKGNATLEDRSIKYPKMFSLNKNEKGLDISSEDEV